ncbi:hypothetical protein K2173_027664 [Erythroxylum novogranatense]|uniref:Morc S5 domain-containing protein n=1 Tax=Erythroxylum novogranatense TaxID=1862640 RepID=A0AAV8TZT5_9ROSI|nr:hypothetical protein K2173_027664 [Erythroxylum novogranatense]
MDVKVKEEVLEASGMSRPVLGTDTGAAAKGNFSVIELSDSSCSSSSSDSDSDADEIVGGFFDEDSFSGEGGSKKKRRKLDELGVVLPAGFLAPLPPPLENGSVSLVGQSCKQFWKAGDYEGAPSGDWGLHSGGMDHVRVHPKFLHSNATSHKWALGAFAELLDNSLDEVCNGATYVNIDMITSKKDGSKMLLIEDNGGGMGPDKMRHCMSLGYSAKSKEANTIGQYGNGFKTSTMRLGADVIVFSRCCGKDGKRPTQSIGLLSYTFLRSTGKEDIVVPMLDYEKEGRGWNKMLRLSADDWNRNVETIVQWSPFYSEADLLCQFNLMSDHGTRIIIYNLWEDDEGLLELDFSADDHDIQLRGVNRDERKIQMAAEFPNSKHFLTYRHSLRSYASILYLRLPPGFRIILRKKDVEHHNIVNDMMLSQEITYRPQPGADGVPKDANMAAVVTIGFVKDAKHHIDVQGFNVYHKNRLIKPFWRLWNAAGSDGRGVIGVLEANFVEPAHDKQGFERTTVLARLETRLIQMQKTYWSSYCHKIGYAPRRNKKQWQESSDKGVSPEYHPHTSSQSKKHKTMSGKISSLNSGKGNNKAKTTPSSKGTKSYELSSPSAADGSDNDIHNTSPGRQANGSTLKASQEKKPIESNRLHKTRLSSCLEDSRSQQDSISGGKRTDRAVRHSQSKVDEFDDKEHDVAKSDHIIEQLKQENRDLKERLKKKEGIPEKLPNVLQCENCKTLERKLQEAQEKAEELNKEQESLIDIFSEERERRDKEEENLRKKLKDAYNTIQELEDKGRLLKR